MEGKWQNEEKKTARGNVMVQEESLPEEKKAHKLNRNYTKERRKCEDPDSRHYLTILIMGYVT